LKPFLAPVPTRRSSDLKRIARGSGTTPQDVNQLLGQFNEMRTMIRQVSSGKGPWAKLARQYGGDAGIPGMPAAPALPRPAGHGRSEEHTSELQSPDHLV